MEPPATAPAAAVFVAAIVTVVVAMAVPVTVTIVATGAARAVAFLVARGVFVAIPVVLNEIDRPAAGTVTVAVASPVLGVAWRYAQVEWCYGNWRWTNDHRLRVDQRRGRITADVDTAVETGLADADRDLGGGWRAECGSGQGGGDEEAFHGIHSSRVVSDQRGSGRTG